MDRVLAAVALVSSTEGVRRLMRLIPSVFAIACTPTGTQTTSDAGNVARTDSIARARQDSINRTSPSYVIDSILPVEEELRRFRTGLTVIPQALVGGTSSRERLAQAFVHALVTRDSAALRRMLMTRAEFAYLVYPASPYTKPPYRQAPGLVWMQISTASAAGYARLLDRVSGQKLSFVTMACEQTPQIQGENRIWRGCTVIVRSAQGTSARLRLFGDIVERHGRFKFVSYANDM